MASECYICTDLTDEISPCKCKAVVHKKCLERFVNETESPFCTICKHDLEGYYIEETFEFDEVDLKLFAVLKCIAWLVCGYFGKLYFALCFNIRLMRDPFFWSPFTLDFLIFASTMYLFIEHIIKCIQYLRCCDLLQYELFQNDSDDDLTDDEDDIGV